MLVQARQLKAHLQLPPKGAFIMVALLITLGAYVVYPVILILVNSFNVAGITEPYEFSMENWRIAFSQPRLWTAIRNTFMVYFAYTSISFPTAVFIAWLLARTRIPFSHGFEFLFWVSFMIPGLAVTLGWIYMLDPDVGIVNKALTYLPFIDEAVFNVYSVPGIVFVHLMGNAISTKVMLLTPAFRNMDTALEEAAHVSGASTMRTLFRVTLPVMMPALVVVFMLNVVRMFSSFETELLLGTPIRFYVYSTLIYDFIRLQDPPQYGQATALASITLGIIAIIVPMQRWLLTRKQYTTVTGQMRPGLISLGKWQPVATAFVVFVLIMLILAPILVLIVGSFMTRVGFFSATPLFTMKHWSAVLSDDLFLSAFRNTLVLSMSTAIISPILFSILAYILVRTNWPGRTLLDSIIWMSAAVPGMLASLGLLWMFLGTPFLVPLYGTIYILVLVIVLQGKLTGSQLFKTAFLQIGQEIEDAARVHGAGWWRTYWRIWVPLIMPTMILIGTFNFILAANTTASIILLASRGTVTLSILSLEWMIGGYGRQLENAGILTLVIGAMTTIAAVIARKYGMKAGVRHQ